MKRLFEIIQKNRKVFLQILRQMPREQLTKIPQGFNNNIWWNIAHVVVTHQLLLYGLGKKPLMVNDTLVANYRKGTYPQGIPTEAEIQEMEELLLTTVEKAENDYTEGYFEEFGEYTTSLGITLSSFEDALAFDTFHEGLHLGVILSLKKVVV